MQERTKTDTTEAISLATDECQHYISPIISHQTNNRLTRQAGDQILLSDNYQGNLMLEAKEDKYYYLCSAYFGASSSLLHNTGINTRPPQYSGPLCEREREKVHDYRSR